MTCFFYCYLDDYFLSNVKTVDEVTEERKRRLLSTTKWKPNIVTALSTWPCVNVLKDLPPSENKGKHCAGCQQTRIYARILLYGQPYNGTTLEGSPPDPRVPHEKVRRYTIQMKCNKVCIDYYSFIYVSRTFCCAAFAKRR